MSLKHCSIAFAIATIILLTGCAKSDQERAGEAAGLTPEQYSKTPEGKQGIKGVDGTKTAALQDPDLASYGVAPYPEATLEDGGAAYERISGANKTITYTLRTNDDLNEVVKFYSEQIGDLEPERRAKEALLSAEIDKGSILVVVTDEGDSRLIRVDISTVEEKA